MYTSLNLTISNVWIRQFHTENGFHNKLHRKQKTDTFLWYFSYIREQNTYVMSLGHNITDINYELPLSFYNIAKMFRHIYLNKKYLECLLNLKRD